VARRKEKKERGLCPGDVIEGPRQKKGRELKLYFSGKFREREKKAIKREGNIELMGAGEAIPSRIASGRGSEEIPVREYNEVEYPCCSHMNDLYLEKVLYPEKWMVRTLAESPGKRNALTIRSAE